MELSRRDALVALAAGGVAAGVGTAALDRGGDDANSSGGHRRDSTPESQSPEFDDHDRETIRAVARVVYPSAVSGVGTFVETYLDGRAAERPEYAAGASEAVARLDGLGEEWHGGAFVDLDLETRDRLLRETGADTAVPDPEGSPAERIRYYLVNELLFALYTSPTGGELAGIENPQGHPGGTASYQRGPGE